MSEDPFLTKLSTMFRDNPDGHFVVGGCPDGARWDGEANRYRDLKTGRFRRQRGVFPEIKVERKSDFYYTFDRADFFRESKP